MADITQYSRWISSIGVMDKIIGAIDESRDFPEIYNPVSKAMEDLMKQKEGFIGRSREFEKQHGIELKLDDPELRKVTHISHGYYAVFDVSLEEFTRIMGFQFSGFSIGLPHELEPYLENQADAFGEVDVHGFNGKTVVASNSSDISIAVMKRYLEGK